MSSIRTLPGKELKDTYARINATLDDVNSKLNTILKHVYDITVNRERAHVNVDNTPHVNVDNKNLDVTVKNVPHVNIDNKTLDVILKNTVIDVNIKNLPYIPRYPVVGDAVYLRVYDYKPPYEYIMTVKSIEQIKSEGLSRDNVWYIFLYDPSGTTSQTFFVQYIPITNDKKILTTVNVFPPNPIVLNPYRGEIRFQ